VKVESFAIIGDRQTEVDPMNLPVRFRADFNCMD
jgi:hypothetical protein